jgi:hypothetical protein
MICQRIFLGWWWRIAVGVGAGFPVVAAAGVAAVGFWIVAEMGVVVGIGVVEFENVAEMGVVVGYENGAAVEVEGVASVPIHGGSWHCTGVLQALPNPC